MLRMLRMLHFFGGPCPVTQRQVWATRPSHLTFWSFHGHVSDFLTAPLSTPYRYLTSPEHAFQPMFMRLLTGLTGLAPQGRRSSGFSPTPNPKSKIQNSLAAISVLPRARIELNSVQRLRRYRSAGRTESTPNKITVERTFFAWLADIRRKKKVRYETRIACPA
jgi:hypothetical protein